MLLLALGACRQEQPKTGAIQLKVESHLEERASVVSFGIEPDGKQSADRWKYKATYTRNGKTAQFGFEFVLSKARAEQTGPKVGSGSFIVGSKSSDADLLRDLQTVLKATTSPQNNIRVRQLPFRFIIEGENLDRGSNGDLIDAATGNWVNARLLLGPQQDQEVLLNFQKPGGTAEFVMADPAFGNGVLRELAKVL